jgi:hypothetical protein
MLLETKDDLSDLLRRLDDLAGEHDTLTERLANSTLRWRRLRAG